MKKLVLTIILAALLVCSAQAGTMYRVRFGYFPDKIRLAFDFDSSVSYFLEEAKEKIIIHLPKTQASYDIQNYIEVNDYIVRYIEVEKEEDGLKISVPLSEPVPYNVFALTEPNRLVIDFNRDFINLLSGGTIIEGVEWLKVSRGTQDGRVTANVLKIDLTKAEVAPALAHKKKSNAVESFVNIFNPWKENDPEKHFLKARIGQIAEDQLAVAAINGTYFAYTGKPLGTLLIDKELVTSPIYDRTALILTEDNVAFIDNIQIDSYFTTPNGVKYVFTGVNQGRSTNGIVMYTPAWGELTGTDNSGLELVVVNGLVKEVRLGNSDIPKDGYVLSFSGAASQFVTDNIKVGDKADVHIKIIPFTTAPRTILHMISGGPRLVKTSLPYVSKFEEKFRADIARGRAARTAVGITLDNKLLLVTVDGLPRRKGSKTEKVSIGMTLEELAELMISLGAVEAMNLDGGSSTAMWIDGRIVSRLTTGYERPVSNALIVRPKYY